MDADLSQGIALFGDFFDAIGLSVAIIDQDGRYAYYNQECSQLDEYTAEQALGAYLLELYPELDESNSTLLQALRQGRSYRNHYQRYRNPRGKAVHQVHTTLPLKRAD
ncbi:arginine utilization regulatory protein r, partial [Chromobacterium sp. LK1]